MFPTCSPCPHLSGQRVSRIYRPGAYPVDSFEPGLSASHRCARGCARAERPTPRRWPLRRLCCGSLLASPTGAQGTNRIRTTGLEPNSWRVSDGIRTRDRRDHNPLELSEKTLLISRSRASFLVPRRDRATRARSLGGLPPPPAPELRRRPAGQAPVTNDLACGCVAVGDVARQWADSQGGSVNVHDVGAETPALDVDLDDVVAMDVLERHRPA